jgi:uncharacterized protein RhaS with RHS repeats
VTPDPIGLAGGMNPYSYVKNNPVGFVDPFGLFESPWYLSWVPGQQMYDLGMTAVENGNYGAAGGYFAGMLAEQVLTVLTLGEGNAASRVTGVCKTKASPASSAIDPNKLRHIFGQARHGLDPLVSEMGSETAAYEAIRKATESAVRSGKLSDVFETTVRVGSQNIVVRGRVVDGVVRIGTAFKP